MVAPRLVVASDRSVAAPVLSVRGLSKAYAVTPVLVSIDLDVRAGEAVAIIGANGTGKSTLVRCLPRLIEPSGGEITLLGQDVRCLNGAGLRRLRARVGFVFQRHNLVARLSALSNVVHGVQSRMSGPRSWCQSLAPRAVREEAMVCLDRVGLADKAASRADALSGGQSQRVAIARMLMQRPDFVIADEPDASLDPKAGEEIMHLLRDVARERGLGLLFVSHNMEHAVRFADRIVGLTRGHVSLDVRTSDVDQVELRAFFGGDRKI